MQPLNTDLFKIELSYWSLNIIYPLSNMLGPNYLMNSTPLIAIFWFDRYLLMALNLFLPLNSEIKRF
jgi:hypothetical protein